MTSGRFPVWLTGFAALVCGGLVSLASPDAACAESISERDVKAAFVSKFAGFIEWPRGAFASSSDPVNLCVQGSDPFGTSLDAVAQTQRVSGRSIRIVRMELVEPSSSCHIAFLGGGKQRHGAALRALAGRPTLTITDEAAPDERGMIDLTTQARKVRFRVDSAAAARSRIVISSKLLALAINVRSR